MSLTFRASSIPNPPHPPRALSRRLGQALPLHLPSLEGRPIVSITSLRSHRAHGAARPRTTRSHGPETREPCGRDSVVPARVPRVFRGFRAIAARLKVGPTTSSGPRTADTHRLLVVTTSLPTCVQLTRRPPAATSPGATINISVSTSLSDPVDSLAARDRIRIDRSPHRLSRLDGEHSSRAFAHTWAFERTF